MNIHDIAQEANVSTATVSRVINTPELVRVETRQRVKDVIYKYRYTPNALAKSLQNNSTRSIGVLTVDILNPYYATVVHSIERELNTQGYHTLLCNTGGKEEEISKYIRTLLEKRVDALVFVGSIYTPEIENDLILESSLKLPIILLNSIKDHDNIWCVLCDDNLGIKQATDYMIKNGRTNLLFVNSQGTYSASIKEKAFLIAVDNALDKSIHYLITEIDHPDIDTISKTLLPVLKECSFDGIVATDDLFANTAINILHDQGKILPDDVWVIGYNNSQVSEYTYPHITSVDSHMEDLGREGARILHSVLNDEIPSPRIQYLTPTLVLKGSTL